jgi:putative redox protein
MQKNKEFVMPQLKATLLETMQGIQSKPDAAKVVFRAETKLVNGVSCTAKVRDFNEMVIDEPPELGGSDKGMNPMELIAAALGTCQEIMYAAYASVMDIKLDAVTVDVKGRLDLRGLFGMDESVPAGYSKISYITRISSQEQNEKIEQLVQAVEAHCPVLDTLVRPITVSGQVFHNETELAADLGMIVRV